MNVLIIVLVLFIILETANIMLLYFRPNSTKGNAVGFFKAFEKSKEDPEVHDLVRYLVFWVAGTKLIFIALLIVILILGNAELIFYSAIALSIAIASYYWKLDPLISKIDKADGLKPKGYSKTLRIMISCFLAIFCSALTYYKLFG